MCSFPIVLMLAILRSTILGPSFFLTSLLSQSPLSFWSKVKTLNNVLFDVPKVSPPCDLMNDTSSLKQLQPLSNPRIMLVRLGYKEFLLLNALVKQCITQSNVLLCSARSVQIAKTIPVTELARE